MNRKSRASIARETVEIANRGWYEPSPNQRVEISAAMDRCLGGTALYRPNELNALLSKTEPATLGQETKFEVANETSLVAARRLITEFGFANALCLNFASAKNPGGGFLGGSQAQEESLARSSGLYRSLLTQGEYYEANRSCDSCLYTDHMIYSPGVPVFRDDDGNLLAQPYCLNIVTAPAPNAGAIRNNEADRLSEIGPVFSRRIDMLLALAADRGCEHLILGAWGCGAFRNDPTLVSLVFGERLEQPRFRNRFRTIVFAVLDTAPDERIITPFRQKWRS
jgi:uncharacterized protein (TIGR02452 family)